MADPIKRLDFVELNDSRFNRTDDYTIDQAIYPVDLMGPESPYGNNMVVFYISVQTDSKLIKDAPERVVRAGAELDRLSSRLANSEIDSTQARSLLVEYGAAVGATGGAILTGKGVDGALVGGAFAVNLVSSRGDIKPETKTIKQAIGLYMPSNLSTAYSMGWDTENTALLSGMVAGQEAYNQSQGIMSGDPGVAATARVASSAISAQVLQQFGSASRLTARAGNPKKEQVFQGVDFRTFNFEYKFWPRNQQEAQAVQNIIMLFKYHMHPEFNRAKGDFIFLYPSEFDIRYYHRTGPDGAWVENLNIHRHTSCVLSNMAVNYGENGVYSSFNDGHPTQISMTLQFKELAILTKENIQNGF